MGTRTASVVFTDNAPNNPQTVTLTGVGTAPAVGLSPGSLAFGSQSLGSTTPAQTVTLSNSGNATLNITSISLGGTNSGDFSQSNNCGTSVAQGANCTISVTFTPSTLNSESAQVVISDNASGSPQSVSLTGAGNGPGVSFSPSSYAFSPSQTVGAASAVENITLTNSGNANLTGISVGITGTNSGDFAQTNTCGSNGTLAPNATCTISVTFTPSAVGARSASVSVTDNAAGSPQTVPLSGTGVSGQISLSPSNLTFPSTPIGSTSSAQTVTVTNTGTGSFTITSSSPPAGADPGDFAETSTCSGTLAAGSSCTITVTFTPAAAGTRTATISINDSLSGSPQTISLTGTGGAPVVNLTVSSLTFPSQTLGTTSAAQTVTLTNQGNAPLAISSIAPTGGNSGDFAETNTCGSSVAVGSSCTMSVTFAPTGTGTRTTTLEITDNNNDVANSQQSVALTGTGTGPLVGLSVSSLSFASQAVASTSAAQTVTLTNSGNAALGISGIAPTGTNPGDFAETNTCGSSVAASATCTISVTFTPTAPGSRSATLSITDNATTSPQTVSLSGTGTAPTAGVSPASLTFSSQTLGTTSSAQTVSLSNTGNASLSLSSIGFTGSNANAFAQTNNCGSSVGAGSSCTISVTFAPQVSGSLSASLVVTDNSNNATGSTQSVTLSGTGTGPVAGLSASSITFSSQDVETTSGSQSVTLTNSGNSPMTISSITLTGANPTNFALVSGTGVVCPSSGGTLTAGSTCTIYATFTPSAVVTYLASISIADNAPGSPQTVTLTGSGIQGIQFSPTSLSFSSTIGTASSAQTVSVSNPTGSSSSVTISGVSLTGSGSSSFTLVSTTCTNATLTPGGASCSISVQFTPTGPGTVSPSISVADNLSTSPQTVTISGTGNGPFASASPTSYTFNAQNVNSSPSAAELVSTLTNTGNASLTVSGITSSDTTEFALATGSGQCTYAGQTLAAGASCGIYAKFAPTAEGIRSAVISIADNASGSPQAVNVSGTGDAPIASLSTSSVTFSTAEPLGQSTTVTTPSTLTLTNNGNVALSISSMALSGSGASNFQASNCGSSLAAGNSCTITLTFTPATPGSLSATLTITDNSNGTAGSTQTLSISGTGSGPVASLPSPATINFGSQTDNTTVTNSIVLSNSSPSNAFLNITSISAPSGTNASDFAIATGSGQCTAGGSVAVGSSCSIYVSFTPTKTSTETASITITDNADPTTQTVSLTGTGTASVVSLSPSTYTFASQTVGTTSSPETITLTNTGNIALTITGVTLGGTNSGDFGLTNGCPLSPSTLGISGSGNNSCTISVTFTPSASGTRTASISIADNATAGSPQAVSLSGTGTAASVGFSPTTLTFGNQNVNTSSSPQTITMTNPGTSALSISSIAMSPSTNFTQTNNCGSSLAGNNGSCTISVTFSPTTSGTLSSSVTVSDPLSTSPQTAGVSGIGGAPQISLTNSSGQTITGLSYGAVSSGTMFQTFSGQQALPYSLPGQPIFTASAAQTITVTNIGSQTLTLTSIAMNASSANPNDFVVNNSCGSSLTANATCTITVVYQPQAYPSGGTSTATLTFTDNNLGTSGSTQNLSLSGAASHDIVLSWNASTTFGVSSYNVYEGTATGQEVLTTPIYCIITSQSTAAVPSCTDPNPALSTTTPTWYTVAAVASGVQSPVASPDVSATSKGP